MSLPLEGQYAIIAGYGLPGRAVAEILERKNIPYCVIELNGQTVNRCTATGIRMIEGDVTQREVLERAEIGRATLFLLTIPDETVALTAIEVARQMNPTVRIIARLMYTSTGLKAMRAGADEVVVAEKVVATELSRLLSTPS